MKESKQLQAAFDKIQADLRRFIDLSMKEDPQSWSDWISSVGRTINVKCWKKKKCDKMQCPAFKNSRGRCWIIAGTMCSGEVVGKFAKKYQSCKECNVYRENVYQNPVIEIEEHLIVLVHSLRTKQIELQEIATTDSLTGLFNRRYFDAYVAHEFEKIKRTSSTVTIIVIDINDFKKVNDELGHTRGDDILRGCAEILLKATRKSDVVARYGGDEFIIALHECCEKGSDAETLIARIDGQVEAMNRARNDGVSTSLSYGYAMLTGNDSVEGVMRLADENMYLDKKRRKSMLHKTRSGG